METLEHTKGPWQLNGYEYDMGRHVYSIQGSEHKVTMPDGSKQQPTIGMIRFRGVYSHNVVLDENGQSDMVNQSVVNHLANAKLISAAPELLEACQKVIELRSLIEYGDVDESNQGQALVLFRLVDMCERAINKAAIGHSLFNFDANIK